jgi:hypothetical protein
VSTSCNITKNQSELQSSDIKYQTRWSEMFSRISWRIENRCGTSQCDSAVTLSLALAKYRRVSSPLGEYRRMSSLSKERRVSDAPIPINWERMNYQPRTKNYEPRTKKNEVGKISIFILFFVLFKLNNLFFEGDCSRLFI